MTMRATRRVATISLVKRGLWMTGTAMAVLAVSGCGENRPFEKEANAVRGSKLIVPSAITPPVRVAEVDGAPDEWKMTARVAEALRVRDIPASSVTKSDSAYVLRGAIKTSPAGKPGQMQVTWVLYDPSGKKVGEVTQSAALPRGQGKTPNDGVVEAMADAAAESIAPIVPSSSVAVADGTETGEAKPNERAEREEKSKVTALGRMKSDSGLAKNFADRAAGKTDSKDLAKGGNADAPGKAEKPSVTERTAPARPPAEAARSGLPTGGSALSRNLLRNGEAPALRSPPPPAAEAALPPPRKPEAPARADRPMTEIFTAEDDARPSGEPGAARAEEEKAPPPNETARSEPPATPPRAEAPKNEPPKAEPKKAEAPKPAPKAEPKIAEAPKPAPKAEPPKAEAPKSEPAKAEPPRDTVKPPAETAKKEPPAARAETAAKTEAPRAGTRFWVQIGAHKTAAEAEGQWAKAAATAAAAGAASHRILRVELGAKGVFHRVQLGPYADKDEALKICAALKARGLDCFLQGEAVAAPAAKTTEAPKPVARPIAAAPAEREEAVRPDEKPDAQSEIEPVRSAAQEIASVEPAAATTAPAPQPVTPGDRELSASAADAATPAPGSAPATYRVIGKTTIVAIAPAGETRIVPPDQRAAVAGD